LTIPAFLLTAPLFVLYYVLDSRLLDSGAHRIAILRSMVVFFVVAAAVVFPWSLRNQMVFGTFVPLSSNGGINLYLGNSPGTRADSGMDADILALCKTASPTMNEIDYGRALQKCAIDWIVAEPGDAAVTYIAKLLNYFNYRNDLTTSVEGASWKFWIVFATYYPLLLLALIRLARFRSQPLSSYERLIFLLYFGNAFASAVFFTRLRFRVPFDFLLICVAAASIARWLRVRDADDLLGLVAAGWSGRRGADTDVKG
jgi:hypothetical protein